MRSVLILFCTCILLVTCKAPHAVSDQDRVSYDLINTYFAKSEKKLYFKTIVNPAVTSTFAEIIDYDTFDYSFNLEDKNAEVDFEELIDFEQLQSLKKHASSMESVKLRRDLMRGNIELSKRLGEDVISTSMPLFFNDNSHALLYEEDRYGGTLIIFKYEDNVWKKWIICPIWIS